MLQGLLLLVSHARLQWRSNLEMTLQGNTSSYAELRSKVVSFMLQHRADFEPFMEDDELFETYCSRMVKVHNSFSGTDRFESCKHAQ